MAADDPFRRDHHPVPGSPEPLAPGLVVVTAGNAGPMTFTGTRTYLLGDSDLAVIDPGPDDPAHRQALFAAIGGRRVAAVLVTHAHLDHSAGAAALAAAVGAPVLAHGDARAARSPTMARLAAAGGLGGGEGFDSGFHPDRRLREGDVVAAGDWTLSVLETPGHLGDHLCFAWAEGRALFSGDTVMGWATTVISPPDGDLAAFRASLARLSARDEAVYYPGHGGPVRDPQRLTGHVLAHRAARDADILATLANGPQTVAGLVARIYRGVPVTLHAAAGRNVLAHLVDLCDRGLVAPEGDLRADARFRLG